MSLGIYTTHIEFDNNSALKQLVGPQNNLLKIVEKYYDTQIGHRGNIITLTGPQTGVDKAVRALRYLYDMVIENYHVDIDIIESVIKNPNGADSLLSTTSKSSKTTIQNNPTNAPVHLNTRKRIIIPRTENQTAYIKALLQNEMIFGIGPAGTGKSYLAVAGAVDNLLEGKIEKIILCRPAVEAGEKIGYLPGDMKEKVDPFLRPLLDALNDMLPSELVAKKIATGEIEIAPLAFMRGRTLTNAYVILDEAQNTTPTQMKMFLTRLGANSKMVINGDLSQSDLPIGQESGLAHAQKFLKPIKEISFIEFNESDIVRHHLVSKIISAYNAKAHPK